MNRKTRIRIFFDQNKHYYCTRCVYAQKPTKANPASLLQVLFYLT